MNGRARVAWNLRRIRAEKQITQEALAVDASVDRTTISGIERAEFNPSLDLLDRLCAALSVDLAELLVVPAANERVPPLPLKAGRKRKR